MVRWFKGAKRKADSFLLNNENPRPAQAGEVIEVRVAEGYSLRHVVVEALLAYMKAEESKLSSVVEQLQDIILSLDNKPFLASDASLSNSFLDSVRRFTKDGVRMYRRGIECIVGEGLPFGDSDPVFLCNHIYLIYKKKWAV